MDNIISAKINVCEPDITEKEINYVTDTIKKKYLSSIAPPVRNFENEFAKRFGMKHAIAVNSGGSALFLTLKGLDIKEGDEVIMPTFTMIATAAAATHCGATPVFVDSHKDNPNIDHSKIEEKITSRTKVIMPVHIYGQPCDMDPIMEIAKKHNLLVIEDAAEVHGSKYKGKLSGTFGFASCFSFYANKLITTGEGGMIITNDDEFADTLRHIRGYDFDDNKHFWHKRIAWNLRMPALAAALGIAQLERLDEFVEKRRKNAFYYMEKLKDIPGLVFFPELPETYAVFWMFGLLAPKRDELMKFLAGNGIETRTFFISMHRQPVYSKNYSDADFPNANRFDEQGFYLPSSSHLTDTEKDYVVSKIREFYKA